MLISLRGWGFFIAFKFFVVLIAVIFSRDSPSDAPVFVAYNEAGVDAKIKPLADNLFGAVYHLLSKVLNWIFFRNYQ